MGRNAILGSILVAILSWTGLGFLVNYTSPGFLTCLGFLLLLFVALMATFTPPAFYFNHRFTDSNSSQGNVRALRQSGLAALFLVLCAWLRMIRVLDWAFALLLLGVLGLVEVVILSRH